MVKLQVLNPQAKTEAVSINTAPRTGDLAGKTSGLYWNLKAGGDVALKRTAYHLSRRFPGVEFRNYVGSVGGMLRHATAEDADRVVRECDAVVATTSD